MDAKPHRPIRALKLRDENQPPVVIAPGKTLHHRNKSSPVLSTLALAGPLKPSTRRAAFADVGNTTRYSNAAKDDSAIPHKNLVIAKDVVLDDHLKAAPLQRPAQRPLSVSALKGFLNNFSSNTQSNSTKAPLEPQHPEQHHSSAPALPKKTLSKKVTSVFRESTLPIQHEHASYEPPLEKVTLLPRRNTSSAGARPSVSTSAPRVVIEETAEPLTSSPKPSSPIEDDARSDGVRLDVTDRYESAANDRSQKSCPVSEYYFDAPSQPEEDASHKLPDAAVESRKPQSSIDNDGANASLLDSQARFGDAGVDTERRSGSGWAEYLDDDGDDFEDFTEARSLKSRGDYTTGHITVVLAPKVTTKVERELAAARDFVLQCTETNELEEDEAWDTSMVAEYGDEIFTYMRKLEHQMLPNPYYMDNQNEVQWSMRSVLMDWLVQVHHRFGLLPETLFLCVNYIDRFLSCKVVSLGKLQLVGATAMLLAAKYEEINCPSIQEIVYMVDGGYTVEEILKAERFMLGMLQFELGWPGPMSFLRRISKADDYDLETRTLAKYFLEITIMDERFVGSPPSFTAAAAHCLARLMLKKGTWGHKHVHYSGYTYSQLRCLVEALVSCCEDAQKHHAAVFDKYADKRFKRASLFVQTEVSRGFKVPQASRSSLPDFVDGPQLENTNPLKQQ